MAKSKSVRNSPIFGSVTKNIIFSDDEEDNEYVDDIFEEIDEKHMQESEKTVKYLEDKLAKSCNFGQELLDKIAEKDEIISEVSFDKKRLERSVNEMRNDRNDLSVSFLSNQVELRVVQEKNFELEEMKKRLASKVDILMEDVARIKKLKKEVEKKTKNIEFERRKLENKLERKDIDMKVMLEEMNEYKKKCHEGDIKQQAKCERLNQVLNGYKKRNKELFREFEAVQIKNHYVVSDKKKEISNLKKKIETQNEEKRVIKESMTIQTEKHQKSERDFIKQIESLNEEKKKLKEENEKLITENKGFHYKLLMQRESDVEVRGEYYNDQMVDIYDPLIPSGDQQNAPFSDCWKFLSKIFKNQQNEV